MHGSTLSFSEEMCGIFSFTREKYKSSLRYKTRAKIAQILKQPYSPLLHLHLLLLPSCTLGLYTLISS